MVVRQSTGPQNGVSVQVNVVHMDDCVNKMGNTYVSVVCVLGVKRKHGELIT